MIVLGVLLGMCTLGREIKVTQTDSANMENNKGCWECFII